MVGTSRANYMSPLCKYHWSDQTLTYGSTRISFTIYSNIFFQCHSLNSKDWRSSAVTDNGPMDNLYIHMLKLGTLLPSLFIYTYARSIWCHVLCFFMQRSKVLYVRYWLLRSLSILAKRKKKSQRDCWLWFFFSLYISISSHITPFLQSETLFLYKYIIDLVTLSDYLWMTVFGQNYK